MKEQIESVRQFHAAFDIPTHDRPTIPTADRVQLRHDLLDEEVNELYEAMKNDDLEKVADGLADCLYIIFGTAHECGMAELLPDIFAEVHRSNMSKLSASGRPLYRHDGKVLKSALYSPPDLKSILKI
jgi:predicted HAD superfamily Cof-like phosphohydrolase